MNKEQVKQASENKTTLGGAIISYKGCVVPEAYKYFQKDIDDFEVFDSDIWICSFPRTGTTWMSEMVWLIANNLDFEKVKIPRNDRVRFLDSVFLFYHRIKSQKEIPEVISDSINYAKKQPHPRVLKTHLPYQLLPKQIQNGERKPKIFYICRNAMDTCFSNYYMLANVSNPGTMEDFYEKFLSGNILCGPYWDHVLPFWNIRHQSNVLLFKYEDMKENLSKEIVRTATFLNKQLSAEDKAELEKYLSFGSMKNNPDTNGGKVFEFAREQGSVKSDFVRKGVVGGYKDEMPESFIEKFEDWSKKNLEGTGLSFKIK